MSAPLTLADQEGFRVQYHFDEDELEISEVGQASPDIQRISIPLDKFARLIFLAGIRFYMKKGAAQRSEVLAAVLAEVQK